VATCDKILSSTVIKFNSVGDASKTYDDNLCRYANSS